jgi:predicted DNA-binding transcriptional regulator AlpA
MTAHVAELPTEPRRRIPFIERPTCSVDDAVQATGLSRSLLYERMRAGELDYVKVGNRRLVNVSSLLKMLGT